MTEAATIKRYEVRVLIGPCTEAEAEGFAEFVADSGQHAACVSVRVWKDDESEFIARAVESFNPR